MDEDYYIVLNRSRYFFYVKTLTYKEKTCYSIHKLNPKQRIQNVDRMLLFYIRVSNSKFSSQ